MVPEAPSCRRIALVSSRLCLSHLDLDKGTEETLTLRGQALVPFSGSLFIKMSQPPLQNCQHCCITLPLDQGYHLSNGLFLVPSLILLENWAVVSKNNIVYFIHAFFILIYFVLKIFELYHQIYFTAFKNHNIVHYSNITIISYQYFWF